MNKVVYKYVMDASEVSFTLSQINKLLKVSSQNNRIFFWFLCNLDDSREVNRTFVLKTTGSYFDDKNLKYIDTVLVDNDNFVAHIFEKK